MKKKPLKTVRDDGMKTVLKALDDSISSSPEKKFNLYDNSVKKIAASEEGANNTLRMLRNKKALIAGMRKFDCLVYKACEFAGVARTTFYDYYRDDAEFKAAIDEITEAEIDVMERSLKNKSRMDTVANIFWLKCKGRKRGWNERVMIDISPESALIPNDVVDSAVAAALAAETKRLTNTDVQ